MGLSNLPKVPLLGNGRARVAGSPQGREEFWGRRALSQEGSHSWSLSKGRDWGVGQAPSLGEWAGASFRLGQGRRPLTPVSSRPGWPCSTGTATWWTTCPSRSSTTFSRASCTSTPRASSPPGAPLRSPLVLRQHTGPSSLCPSPRSSPASVAPSPPLDCSPHLLAQPCRVWGTCREPPHTLLSSHLWTDCPLVSGLGVGEGRGVGAGGSAVPGDVLASVSQHAPSAAPVPVLPACSGEAALALAFPACPLPRRAILFFPFFLFLSSLVFFCSVLLFLLLFTPHRIWMKSVSVVLYVCSLDAFLWW